MSTKTNHELTSAGSSSTFKDYLGRTIYKLPVSQRKRDRPMKVLVLGLSRTGTDSLRSALLTLGYRGVYHGFVCATQPEDCTTWVPLLQAKWAGKFLTAKDFDPVLGQFEAGTDSCFNLFGPELLAAYPDAKVIVNRRKDLDAWQKSMKGSVINLFENPFLILCSWFEARLWWLWRVHFLSFGHKTHYNWDRNGKQFAVEHYQELDRILNDTGRSHLTWYIEDGWEPLCQYLGKDVPETAFPRGNAVGKEFNDKVEAKIGALFKTAMTRMAVTLACLIFSAIVLWRRYRS